MAAPIRVFFDSDVLVSSQLSATGAAYLLVNGDWPLARVTINYSIDEVAKTLKRLDVPNRLELGHFTIGLNPTAKQLGRFLNYVTDPNDAPIVAGAALNKVRFLVSYNLKDYDVLKIRQDFKLIILRPGQLMQYLRTKG